MDKENCPACKSDKTELLEIDGETWWKCSNQGCDGRTSGAWFYFRRGEGLAPKQRKQETDDAEEEASA